MKWYVDPEIMVPIMAMGVSAVAYGIFEFFNWLDLRRDEREAGHPMCKCCKRPL